MNRMFKIFMVLACLTVCHDICADRPYDENTPAIKALESGRKTRRLEGATLKIARPIIKNTPMSAVLDDIDMMMFCPVEKNSRKDDGFMTRVESALKGYMLAHEIDDELSHMLIYVNEVNDNRFTELILYITDPDRTILYFRGDFTVEGLMKVGELSEQDRKKRIRTKRETGQDNSYLQYTR